MDAWGVHLPARKNGRCHADNAGVTVKIIGGGPQDDSIRQRSAGSDQRDWQATKNTQQTSGSRAPPAY